MQSLDHCRITIKLSLWCSTALPEVISPLSGRCILSARDLWLLLVGLMKDLCLSLFQFISRLSYPALSALGLTSVIGLCAYLHSVINCWGKTEGSSLRSFIKMQARCYSESKFREKLLENKNPLQDEKTGGLWSPPWIDELSRIHWQHQRDSIENAGVPIWKICITVKAGSKVQCFKQTKSNSPGRGYLSLQWKVKILAIMAWIQQST